MGKRNPGGGGLSRYMGGACVVGPGEGQRYPCAHMDTGREDFKVGHSGAAA